MLQLVFLSLASLSLLRALLVLRSQRRFWRKLPQTKNPVHGQGPAVILAPVKGIDPDFQATLDSLLRQDYADPYDLIFAAADPKDPALALVNSALQESLAQGELRARHVHCIATGPCHDRGQKVHNLSCGLAHMAADIRLISFIDADARPARDWLAQLSLPLRDEKIGATTGFRWYLPLAESGVNSLASLWNAMALGLVTRSQGNFAWGGSMAILRQTFEDCAVIERYWKGSVSDDGGLTAAMHDAQRGIAFVPACLLPSYHNFTPAHLWEFVLRQCVITRIYLPVLYRWGIGVASLDGLSFWGGLAYSIARSAQGDPPWLLIALLGFIYLASCLAGRERYRGILHLLPAHASAIQSTRWILQGGAPFAWLLSVAGLWAALGRRRIVWRGITYQLLGKRQLLVQHGEKKE